MKRYKLVCMAFDGDFIIERPCFESVDAAWSYADGMGSKWFFYPFYFVVSGSGKTVVSAPDGLKKFEHMRMASVVKRFSEVSARPEMQGASVDTFSLEV